MNTGIQDNLENKPVFDPDFHTELIIKDEYEDFDSGNVESSIITVININTVDIICDK